MEEQRRDTDTRRRVREELGRRAGILEDLLSRNVGGSPLTWGMVVLAAGALWAGYELVSALIFFFG